MNLLLVFLLSIPGFAQTGADILLQNVDMDNNAQKEEVKKATGVSSSSDDRGLKLSDPFLIEFYTSWRSHKGLPYDVNRWAMEILRHRFKQAAHLWTVIEKKAPADFLLQARITRLYLMWRLDLAQTFASLFISEVSNRNLKSSKLMLALDRVVGEKAPQWFLKNAPLFTKEQERKILRMDASKNNFLSTAKFWVMLRAGKKAIPYLPTMPAEHPFKIPLVRTAVLDLARQNELGRAGSIMKREMEPAIHKKNDPRPLAQYYLTLGRLLYQAGALDAAEEFYRKVPNSFPEFLNARTELLWVLLRKGDVADLRGELTSLGSGLFAKRFFPEIYLVRSISNLKLCQYDLVAKDFNNFIENNRNFAQKIKKGLENKTPPASSDSDFFIDLAKISLEKKEAEASLITSLGKESINATLPAVGVQAHWEKAKKNLLVVYEEAKKRLSGEYHRYWKNQERILSEAIRKMKFVKVETMTQMYAIARDNDLYDKSKGDQVSTVQASRKNLAKDRLSFPFDGVLWPDELFKMQSAAKNYCLQKMNKN
ncbi:MAG: hypothetical protein OXB84_00930 [Halobacteriovoraceae bacterium]|nr:hypothetical protein [Halobacteriovoraceae bacterium]